MFIQNYRTGLALMVGAVIAFSLNTLGARWVADVYPCCDAAQISFFRGIAGLWLVWLLYSGGRGLRMRSLIDRPLLTLRGLLGGIGLLIYYLTVIELGATRASVLNVTYPIFAAVLALIVLREPLGPAKMIWILLGFVGLVIFLQPGGARTLVFYDALALIGAIMSAVVIVLIRKLHQTEHSSTIFASQATFAILVAVPLAGSSHIGEMSVSLTLWLVCLGVLVAAGQLLMTFSFRHLDVSTGSTLMMTIPILTGFGAWIAFGETLTHLELLGATLTIISATMVNRQS